jgi:amino acid transporter
MKLQHLRQALFGSEKDVYDPRLFRRITVGAVAAWIAMGGDLLGSCVYGPNVLGGGSGGHRGVLLVVTAATLLTLALLAHAYTRMVARFPHGGGGYTAARHVVGERLSLMSGVALVFDAAFNVAVSVVTCVDAASDALPHGWGSAKLPIALLLIVLLTFVNLRGIKESIALVTPIVVLFVGSHLVVLVAALVHRAGALPAAVASVPTDVRHLAAEHGRMAMLGTMVRAYALGGSIYTGLESISNGVPILREPKVQTARRTMVLLAGIPGLVLLAILVGYFLYDVRPAGDETLNAILFEHAAAAFGGGPLAHGLMVTVPLLSEAALLIVAAQTGFVDGPRILGALATDRFMPRRLMRLNGRLAPAPGILVIATLAFVATLLVRGALSPLLVVFVVSVFVTFSISQWAMFRDAASRRSAPDAIVHAVSLVLCLVILGGTIESWRAGSVAALALILVVTVLALVIRRRYDAIERAVEVRHADAAPPGAVTVAGPPQPVAADPSSHHEPPIAVLLVDQRREFGRLALDWLGSSLPVGLSGIVLASVSLIDAEAVESEGHLRQLEAARRKEVERLAAEARSFGLPVTVDMRRGADVFETAVAMIKDLMRSRSKPSVVVGFRSALDETVVDPLLRDDLAVKLQARLGRERIPMIVVSIPLPA